MHGFTPKIKDSWVLNDNGYSQSFRSIYSRAITRLQGRKSLHQRTATVQTHTDNKKQNKEQLQSIAKSKKLELPTLEREQKNRKIEKDIDKIIERVVLSAVKPPRRLRKPKEQSKVLQRAQDSLNTLALEPWDSSD